MGVTFLSMQVDKLSTCILKNVTEGKSIMLHSLINTTLNYYIYFFYC